MDLAAKTPTTVPWEAPMASLVTSAATGDRTMLPSTWCRARMARWVDRRWICPLERRIWCLAIRVGAPRRSSNNTATATVAQDRTRDGELHQDPRDHHRSGRTTLDLSRRRATADTTCITRRRPELLRDHRAAAAGTRGTCHLTLPDPLGHQEPERAPPLTCTRVLKPGRRAVPRPLDQWAACPGPDPVIRPPSLALSTTTAAMDPGTTTTTATMWSRRAPRTTEQGRDQRTATTAPRSHPMQPRRLSKERRIVWRRSRSSGAERSGVACRPRRMMKKTEKMVVIVS